MAKETPKGGRPPKSDRLPDGAGSKKYPYSIRATIRGIREFWHRPSAEEVSTVEEFADDIRAEFDALQLKYPGHGERDPVGLIKRISGGKQSPNYFDLRLFSEAIGVPTSILYIFTHLVGDVARDGDKENALNLLASTAAALDALRVYIYEADPDGNPRDLRKAFLILHGAEEDHPPYDTRLDGLRRAAHAFRGLRGRRFRRDDGLVG